MPECMCGMNFWKARLTRLIHFTRSLELYICVGNRSLDAKSTNSASELKCFIAFLPSWSVVNNADLPCWRKPRLPTLWIQRLANGPTPQRIKINFTNLMARSCSHGFLERPTCLQHILTILVQHLRSAWMTWSWMETSVNGWSTQLFHHQEPRHIKHFVIGIFLSQTTGVATTRKLPLICEVPPYCNGFKTWQ